MFNFLKRSKHIKLLFTLIFICGTFLFGSIWEISAKKQNLKDVLFGVMKYDYNNISVFSQRLKKLVPAYTPWDVNIGDYIQSLAAMQYLPKGSNPVMVGRDTLGLYNGKPINLIANGWFILNKDNEVFSKNINPIFVAFHISNPDYLNIKTINYLKKYQPIGCRDYNTCRELSKRGVKSYFSGCLTTTLDIDYKVPDNQRTGDIIFCDYKFGDYKEADNFLKFLKNYNFNKIKFITHSFTKNSTQEQRFNTAKEYLNLYAKAGLVVTTRIHCALPCLALGTPVILVNRHYDHGRFDGLYELLNTVGTNKEGKFNINVKFDSKGKVVNSNAYLKYANALKEKVKNEISKAV